LEQALALKPDLARANFFYARILKEEGKYDDAIARLKMVLAQYPRDRVVHNEVGRILFLQKHYADAVAEFRETLSIDPEDLQAHYNMMLCYSGLGDEMHANEHKERYLRFKADESAQAITGPYRQAHPEDNNERQPIHEHVSVALTAAPAKQAVVHKPDKSAKTDARETNQPGGGLR
jgi:tetratricopeptide (TPR) repeat protein